MLARVFQDSTDTDVLEDLIRGAAAVLQKVAAAEISTYKRQCLISLIKQLCHAAGVVLTPFASHSSGLSLLKGFFAEVQNFIKCNRNIWEQGHMLNFKESLK